MNRKTAPAAILLLSFANCVMLCRLQAGATESEQVYYGEVLDKSKDTITINVNPCGDKKKPQTISPYEILSSQETSCNDGRKYVKVAVREQKSVDSDGDNKRSPTEPDKKKEKPPREPSVDSPNSARLAL
jgi:hypothetical protein